MRKLYSAAALPLFLLLTACPVDDDAEHAQRAATNQALNEAQAQISMPAIANFQERRMAKEMLERRDQKIATFSYLYNGMRGCLIFLGNSVGYGLPYATQYTNPQKSDYFGSGVVTLPQAEPNGLYIPGESHATWVMLQNPDTGNVEPTYVEPDMVVSPFRLKGQECTATR